ncbi:hypothetical protein, partial [Bifidobacterium bifidum]
KHTLEFSNHHHSASSATPVKKSIANRQRVDNLHELADQRKSTSPKTPKTVETTTFHRRVENRQNTPSIPTSDRLSFPNH